MLVKEIRFLVCMIFAPLRHYSLEHCPTACTINMCEAEKLIVLSLSRGIGKIAYWKKSLFNCITTREVFVACEVCQCV